VIAPALGGDDVLQRAALRRGVFEMARVEVQPAAVEQKAAIAGDLTPLARGRLDQAELTAGKDAVLDPRGGLGRAEAAGAGVFSFGAEEGSIHGVDL